MKLFSILTSPVLVLVCFCLVLVSGQHFGGFYLLYILIALPHAGIHAVLALIGAGLLVFSYIKFKRQSRFFIDPLLNVLGVFGLYLSLYLFFVNSWHYNDQTFRQAVPLASLILFGSVSLGCIVHSIVQFARPGLRDSTGVVI